MLEMIFEVGFNYCCRNFFGGNVTSDNLALKLSANLLNELTNVTENCILEFSGNWAKTLSFVQPGMDMKVSATLPTDSSSWNECVVIQNLSCPEPVETRYVISKISVIETVSRRYMEFDKNHRIVECKIDGQKTSSDMSVFPNHWMSHKRSMVDKNLNAFRPLTSITQDVPVINVVVAFLANSPPGPYRFTHPTDPYVRAHVHVCDLSFRNLKLAAIRASNEDMKDVPAFHLHLQIDKDVVTSALPWLTVGDVMMVQTVKPIFAQKQAWNLLHKQKKFGETKIKIWKIESPHLVVDVEGNETDGQCPPSEVTELQSWIKNRLIKDTLVGNNHGGKLGEREIWIGGHDVVCKITRVNNYTSSIFVTDYTLVDGEEEVEVRIRTSQQRIGETLEYLFTHLEGLIGTEDCYVLLRNVRTTTEKSVFCSLEHVTRVPEFCRDVQDLLKRKDGLGDDVPVLPTIADPTQTGLGMEEMIPKEWKEAVKRGQERTKGTQDGCVDSSSQIQFEFVDADTPSSDQENFGGDTQLSDEASQLFPRQLKFDTNTLRDSKRRKIHD